MIKYALKCVNDHQFDSWFRDSAAYEDLIASGSVTCVVCGDPKVSKAIMAPQVRLNEAASDEAQSNASMSTESNSNGSGPLSAPASPAEAALRELRQHVEANADDVGDKFAEKAREMHDGDAPERAIYGSAKLEEAKALIEDGIPVAPLPWGRGKTQ